MTVYLVGAGPGDPGLLTRRGADLLAQADVVVYDRLIDHSLIGLAPPGALRVDVGKRPGGGGERGADGRTADPAARQVEINGLLVTYGRRHPTVVRLKGGDAFLFGRGGEEAEALSAAGVAWEVVPGVTSAVAVPAAAGIPVTHRGLSTSVTVVTGQVGDPTAPGGADWEALGRASGTVVVLMGMATRGAIARGLRAGGRDPQTPVAVVEWGTTPAQRVARTTLEGLEQVDLGPPAVIVVGEVAGLDLGSVGRPLTGRVVAVTRPAEQSGPLVAALAAAGARVVVVPVVEIGDPDDGGAALAAAATRVHEYDWVAFSSANAVHRFVPLLRDGRALARCRLATVGAATAAALASWRLVADLVPSRPGAEGLVADFPEAGPGGRALLPRAAGGRPELAAGLRRRGWDVDEVVAYRTVPRRPAPGRGGRPAGGVRHRGLRLALGGLGLHRAARHGRPAPHRARPAGVHRADDGRGGPDAGTRPPGRRRLARRGGRRPDGLRRRPGGPGARPRGCPGAAGRLRGWASPWTDRGGCAAPPPCAGWWPRPGCRSTTWWRPCSSGRTPPKRCRSPRCPASTSTRWPPWSTRSSG